MKTDRVTLIERVYSAEKTKGKIIGTFSTIANEFPSAHALGLRFAERNIRTKYRDSFLGFFWAFLPPLITASVWIILNSYKVISLGEVGAPYPAYVVTGMMLWSIFTTSIVMPLQTFQSSRSILVKINFPRESLIVTAFYEILFNVVISLIIIAVCLVVLRVPIGFNSLLFFPGVLVIIVFGMGLGLILLPFSLLLKDIQFILPSILQLAMYLTPVVYAKPIYKGAAKLLELNPVTPLLTSTRGWLLSISMDFPMYSFTLVTLIALVLFILGVLLQRKTMQILIERMGS